LSSAPHLRPEHIRLGSSVRFCTNRLLAFERKKVEDARVVKKGLQQ